MRNEILDVEHPDRMCLCHHHHDLINNVRLDFTRNFRFDGNSNRQIYKPVLALNYKKISLLLESKYGIKYHVSDLVSRLRSESYALQSDISMTAHLTSLEFCPKSR